ncbi:hypothetical protein ABZ260_35360 [Streptosporangium sp. NPDC006013]|uniref:hypothetical protein n=1 Tax=Streptosporangium sp. NPDC006013 TaxID=3155596 RepID=UPI0033B0E975
MGQADEQGFGYTSAGLTKSGNDLKDAGDALKAPLEMFKINAAPTSSCFGLVPQGSEELAEGYQDFFRETTQILEALQVDLSGSGVGLMINSYTYRGADGAGPV